jgi:transcription initiation factor TFIIIB Brf1 subunit/transcription initiation factor TFIIB
MSSDLRINNNAELAREIAMEPVEKIVRKRTTNVNNRKRALSPTPSAKSHSFPKSKEELQQQQIKHLESALEQNYASSEAAANTSSGEAVCKHEETEVINGVIECMECGQHLDEIMDQEQEWRYYGDNDNKNANDPSRCQFRKVPDKGIRKDLEKLNLPSQVINIADQYYYEITQGDIKRGDLRKGIMFACVFEAYNDIGKTQMPNQLLKLFDIDKRTGGKGMHYFLKRKTKKQRNYITPEQLIPKICEKFDLVPEVVTEIQELYKHLKVKAPRLDHSYPQSVACGCVYFMLKRKNFDITGEQFGKMVSLSSITVVKKSNEIEEILNNE